MTVQITGRQIANSAVDVNKLDLSSGTFDFTSAVLQVATPSSGSDAATKTYVDNAINGLAWKKSVKVATVANITLSGTQTIDNIAVSADDRVLVRKQTTQSENGIYICKSGSWERADDMDAASEFSGSAVFVEQGDTFADTGFVCTNDGDVTVGTTNIEFTQFTGLGSITAGEALTKTGSTIDVNVDDSSIEVSSDALQIKALGVTNAMLAGSIANAKLSNSTISGVSLGSNLNSLSAGNGLSMTSYNGSAAVSDLTIDLDGSSLAVGADGIKVADLGVTNAMLAGSIAASKLAGSIPSDKLNLGNGVEDNGGNLQIALDGGSLALGAGGLSIAADGVSATEIADGAIDAAAKIVDGVVTNAKLAGSIAASKLAGSIPADKLNLGNGLNDNGGNLDLDLDGSTLALGADGVKVADLGVGTSQLAATSVTTAKLAANSVTNAKLADDSVKTGNLDFAGFFAAFDADGSTAGFELSGALDLEFKEFFVVTVNGLVMEYKDTPDAQDNYKIANDGTGSVGKITFGANLANGDRVTIRGFINN